MMGQERLNKSLICKAIIFTIADNQMIDQMNIHRLNSDEYPLR